MEKPTVEKLPDGTRIQTSANGTVLKLLPDGTKVQTSKDGVELIVYPDGRKVQTNAKGVKVFTNLDGSTKQVNVDGTTIETLPDKKTRTQTNPDGTKILSRPDGTKLQTLASGAQFEIDAMGKKTPVGAAAAARPPAEPVAAVAAPLETTTPVAPTVTVPAEPARPLSSISSLFSSSSSAPVESQPPPLPPPSQVKSLETAALGASDAAAAKPKPASAPPPLAARPVLASAAVRSAAVTGASYGANEIRTLQTKYDALLKSNGDLKNQLATVSASNTANEAAAAASAAALVEERNRIAALEAELEVSKENAAHLQRQLTAKEGDSEAVSKAAAEHARRLVKLESEKERAEAAIRDVERELTAVKEQLEQEKALRAQVENEHSTLLGTHGEEQAALQALLDESREQEATTAGSLAAALAEKAALEAKLTQVVTLATSVEQERAALQTKLVATQAKLQLAETRLEDSIVKGGGAADMLAELKFSKATAEERVVALTERVAALQTEVEAVKHLHQQAKAENEATLRELAPVSQRALLSTQLEQDLEVAKAMKEAAEQKHAELLAQHETLHTTHQQVTAELAKLRDGERGADLEKNLEMMTARALEAEALAIEAGDKLDELKNEVKSLTLEKEEMRLKLEMATAALATTPHSGSEPLVQTPAHSEHDASGAVSSASSSHSGNDSEIRALTDKVNLMAIEVADARAQARNAETTMENLRAQHSVELSALLRDKEELEKRLTKPGTAAAPAPAKGGLLSFAGKSSRKMAAQDHSEPDANELADRLSQREKELEELRTRAEGDKRLAQSQITGLEEKIHALEFALQSKTSELEALIASQPPPVAEGEVDVAKLQQQVRSLEQELQAKTTRVDVAVMARTAAEEKAVSAEARATQLQAEVDELKAQLASHAAAAEPKHDSAMEAKVVELEAALQTARAELAAHHEKSSSSNPAGGDASAAREQLSAALEEKRMVETELEQTKKELEKAQQDLWGASNKATDLTAQLAAVEKQKNEITLLYNTWAEKKPGGGGMFGRKTGSGKEKDVAATPETLLLEAKQQVAERERELASCKTELRTKTHDIEQLQAKLDAATKDKDDALHELRTQAAIAKDNEAGEWKVKLDALEREKNAIIATLSNELAALKNSKASGGGAPVAPASRAPPPDVPAPAPVAPTTSSAPPPASAPAGNDFLSLLKQKKEQAKPADTPPVAAAAAATPVASASSSSAAPAGGELSGVAALRAKFNKKP